VGTGSETRCEEKGGARSAPSKRGGETNTSRGHSFEKIRRGGWYTLINHKGMGKRKGRSLNRARRDLRERKRRNRGKRRKHKEKTKENVVGRHAQKRKGVMVPRRKRNGKAEGQGTGVGAEKDMTKSAGHDKLTVCLQGVPQMTSGKGRSGRREKVRFDGGVKSF